MLWDRNRISGKIETSVSRDEEIQLSTQKIVQYINHIKKACYVICRFLDAPIDSSILAVLN